MLKRSVLLSEAHFAIEHVGRLKRGATSVANRPLLRRVRALAEAALKDWNWKPRRALSFVIGERNRTTLSGRWDAWSISR